jgi:AP2 domain/HNH endonuclease
VDSINDISIQVIPLTHGMISVVDAIDGPRVMKHSWSAVLKKGGGTRFEKLSWDDRLKNRGKFYAYGHAEVQGRRSVTGLARFILNAPKGAWVDHINGVTLDNRRKNLRLCEPWQNAHNAAMNKNNTSGYRGVSWNKTSKKWVANIRYNGKSKYLGAFDDPVIAAMTYDQAARLHVGGFASLNFPDAYLE